MEDKNNAFPSGINPQTATVFVAYEIARLAMSLDGAEIHDPAQYAEQFVNIYRSVYKKVQFDSSGRTLLGQD